MKVYSKIEEIKEFPRSNRKDGKVIGFVPTMGYLHEGHLSLIKLAKKNSDVVIVSIYINPIQFSINEDFDKYPRNPKRDHELLESIKCDAVFEPVSLYTDSSDTDTDIVIGKNENSQSFRTFVTVEKLQEPLCGQSRPHFFRGVTTVVAKLFNIIEPDVAVFGLKDYQQYLIIKTMTKELDFPINIIGGPILREADGLAMSSRNVRLHPDARTKSTIIYEGLKWAEKSIKNNLYKHTPLDIQETIFQMITKNEGMVDYVEVVDSVKLTPILKFDSGLNILIAVAAFFNDTTLTQKVRLIDNIIFDI